MCHERSLNLSSGYTELQPSNKNCYSLLLANRLLKYQTIQTHGTWIHTNFSLESDWRKYQVTIVIRGRVTAIFPIIKVFKMIYFNIFLDVRIHKNKPNPEHLLEFTYTRYFKSGGHFPNHKSVQNHVRTMVFRVHILKYQPNSEHLLEFTYTRYFKSDGHFPKYKSV